MSIVKYIILATCLLTSSSALRMHRLNHNNKISNIGQDPCSQTFARRSVDTHCPKMTSQPWLEHWEGCTSEAICNFRNHPEFGSPEKFLEIVTRKGKEGYMPNTLRLQQVLADATLSNRKLRVLAYGSSVTHGTGCSENGRMKWTDKLQYLSHLAGSPMALEIQNLARSGSTLASTIPEFGKIADAKIDLVVLDFSMNDNPGYRGENHTQSVEDVVAVLNSLPNKPAVLFLETLSFRALKELSEGKQNVCNIQSSHPDFFPHWELLKRLGVPSVHFSEIACSADGSDVHANSNDGKPQLNYWPHDEEVNHPACGVHDTLAHLMFQYLTSIKHEACTSGYSGVLNTVAGEVGDLTEMQQCMIRPLDRLTPNDGFPAENSTGWTFYEDVPGKPGWISTGDATDIVFDVHLATGIATVEYLSSYAGIGAVTCWIEGEDSSTHIDGHWNLAASLSNSATLRASDGKCRAARMHCRGEGAKFKILSVTTC